MTWYWWSHWFWITLISALSDGAPISAVDTGSLKILQANGKGYSKREPLKFPLPVQDDSEDIFGGDSTIFNGADEISWLSTSEKVQENSIETNINKINISTNNGSTIQSGTNNLGDNIREAVNLTINSTSSTLSVDVSNKTLSSRNSTIEEKSNPDSNNTEIIPTDEMTTITSIEINSTEDTIIDEVNEEIELRRNLTRLTATAGIDSRSRKSKILAEYREIDNITGESKNLLARAASISVEHAGDGLASQALSIEDDHNPIYFNAGLISGICLAVIGLFCGVSIAVIIMYRRRYINKPQTLSEPDSSGYIDDSTIRDNSDEMYSLDNDSFLNSLEAMTIQNYWTDSVKHTKL